MSNAPRRVTIRPWRWHDDNTRDIELCAVLSDRRSQVVIGAADLRRIADYLYTRAEESETHR